MLPFSANLTTPPNPTSPGALSGHQGVALLFALRRLAGDCKHRRDHEDTPVQSTHMKAPSTPHHPIKGPEADTIKRSRFFKAYNSRSPGETIKVVAARYNIPKHTFPPFNGKFKVDKTRFIDRNEESDQESVNTLDVTDTDSKADM